MRQPVYETSYKETARFEVIDEVGARHYVLERTKFRSRLAMNSTLGVPRELGKKYFLSSAGLPLVCVSGGWFEDPQRRRFHRA